LISEIKGIDSDKLPSLHTLELRENKLITTKGIKLPNLKSLFIVIKIEKKRIKFRKIKYFFFNNLGCEYDH
jgi:hypothetical protein